MTDDSSADALKISNYIKNNSSCKVVKPVTVTLQGKQIDLQTYHIPLDFTYYNIKNGRFAAEYMDLIKKEKRKLDPKNPDDSKKIQLLLFDLDLKQSRILENDLLEYGQKDPGIITHDGFVINGNRRRSVLEELSSKGHSQFKFIDVARLPPNVSSQDLWKIEAGIQLSKNVQVVYGPINELLKFQEGINAGLSPADIAKSLYGGINEKDILNKIEHLKLIRLYLNFIREPDVYNNVKDKHEHFVDLQNILNSFEKIEPHPDEILGVRRIGFQLIHDGVLQRDLRKIKAILANDETKKEIWEAMEYSKPEESNKKREKLHAANRNDEFTPARTIFVNCLDSLKALSESEQPEKLLLRAMKNLERINTDSLLLKKPASLSLILNIETIIKKLRKL